MHYFFPLPMEARQNSKNTTYGNDLFFEALGEEVLDDQKANNYYEFSFPSQSLDAGDMYRIILKCKIFDEPVPKSYFDSITLSVMDGPDKLIETELSNRKRKNSRGESKDYIAGTQLFSRPYGFKLCCSLNRSFEKGPFTITAYQVSFKKVVGDEGEEKYEGCEKAVPLGRWKVGRHFTPEELALWDKFLKKRKRASTSQTPKKKPAKKRKQTPNKRPTKSAKKPAKKPAKKSAKKSAKMPAEKPS